MDDDKDGLKPLDAELQEEELTIRLFINTWVKIEEPCFFSSAKS